MEEDGQYVKGAWLGLSSLISFFGGKFMQVLEQR